MGPHKTYHPVVFSLIALFLFEGSSYAQQGDSALIYDKIKAAASKRTLTTWIYQAIFVDPAPKEYPIAPEEPERNVNPYLKHNNKIIRSVKIAVYNPFGHKVIDDSIKHVSNVLENIANHVHINTRQWIITNRLLFKENDTLNPLALSETERLLRQTDFINDARIYTNDSLNSDSVDVFVDVFDKWAISAPFQVSPQGGNFRFVNQNLFGIGQQFEQYVGYKTPNRFDFSGFYNIANLDNTYISSSISYRTNASGTYAGIAFNRPYFSPLTQFAGGINVNHNWGFYQYTDTVNKIDKKLTLNTLGYDIWTGRSFKLQNSKTLFNQSTNIILGGRYFKNIYMARPSFDIDTARSNFNTMAVIGNVGFSVQQYYKEKYIYRFGSNEDVPEGLIVQMTYGVSKKEFDPMRYYVGGEIARAKKFRFGYLTSTLSSGLFFNRYSSNDMITKFKLYYLSNLVRKGRWYFREFVNYNVSHGMNRLPEETTSINSDELYGFNSNNLICTSKMILNIEAVAYAPYNLIGFKFAGVAMAGCGLVANKISAFDKSPLYQAYSVGLLIRNEHLVSSTFQISVGMYPFLPDGRNNVFSFNPITSFTLRVRGFSMGMPDFVNY